MTEVHVWTEEPSGEFQPPDVDVMFLWFGRLRSHQPVSQRWQV